jgi:catechol 2,3-dioxygenase-like lactoylglutathione lyase family enzyme
MGPGYHASVRRAKLRASAPPGRGLWCYDREMIRGVNHVTLSVRDLEASIAFYRDVLGMRLAARWPSGAYLAAGSLWLALLVDRHARPGAAREYTHVALDVAPADFEALAARVRASGATLWQENTSEGASLYFLDPTGHKLELHAGDLATRLASGRVKPWAGLEVLDD